MDSFQVQIEKSANQLKDVWTTVRAVSNSVMPPRCYEYWIKKASLHQTLAATTGLFPARDTAWKAVQAVTSSANIKDPSRNLVTHGALDMDFSIARLLALTSYVTITWSIYDRMTNICGRLTGVAELADNPKQNPKLCEHVLGKKNALGFGAHLHIQQAYAWPIRVAYKVRNWLVHEGYEEGGIPLFKGDRIADGFRLHDDAAAYLEKKFDYNEDHGKVETCCLRASEECWPSRELLDILEKYHAEIDMMFVGLVKWSVDSFDGQVRAFTERDEAALISSAIRGQI